MYNVKQTTKRVATYVRTYGLTTAGKIILKSDKFNPLLLLGCSSMLAEVKINYLILECCSQFPYLWYSSDTIL